MFKGQESVHCHAEQSKTEARKNLHHSTTVPCCSYVPRCEKKKSKKLKKQNKDSHFNIKLIVKVSSQVANFLWLCWAKGFYNLLTFH